MVSLRLAIAAALVVIPTAVHADGSGYMAVGSAFDADDPFDLHFSLDYGFESRGAAIRREVSGEAIDPNGPSPIAKDLLYSGARHTLTPKLRMGVFTDVEVSVALPIVIRDSYTLEFDQSASPCVMPPAAGTPTCINALNSTTVVDGLLPANGFDADDPSGPGFTDPNDPMIFRGTTRKGLDQIHLGAAWAPMNPYRDPSKPMWKIGAELRVAIGDIMELDRLRPDKSTGVSRGVHELRLWTSMAKRVSWSEPFMELYWQTPIGTSSDSRFLEVGYGAEREAAQQVAGTRFGFEGIAWENAAAEQRIGLEFSALIEGHFEGRAYSEMWEVFQYAGDPNAGGPLVIDEDPTTPGVQALAHPGVTNVENYLRFAGRFRVNAQIGERIRFGTGFELLHNQAHAISFADAGVDLPLCRAGATVGCEDDDDDTVDPNSAEVNPMHVPLIDQAGHRYRVAQSTSYNVLVHAMLLF